MRKKTLTDLEKYIKEAVLKELVTYDEKDELIAKSVGEWIPLDEFLAKVKLTRHSMNGRLRSKQWKDGFVVRKYKGKYIEGNLAHFEIWKRKYWYKRGKK